MTEHTTFDARDDFNRKPIAENIIKLIDQDGFSPMLLDGPWGSGKTEFSHKLMNLINETHKDWQVAYIDSFKADHSNEPLMTIIASIANLLEKEKKSQFGRLVKSSIPLLRFTLKTGGKALISHLLKQNTDELSGEFKEALGDIGNEGVDAAVANLLSEYMDVQENMDTLQNSLREIATKENPLVLIIDELDRCRPDFAVEILELIKHVFDVPNVHFLLVTNTQQLKAAVNHRYGAQVDAQRYLDKFLKLRVQISPFINKADKSPKSIVLHKFIQELNLSPELRDYDAKNSNDMRFKFLQVFSEINPFSLRETETLVRNMEVYDILSNHSLSTNQYQSGHGLFEFLGLILVTFNPQLANSIVENRITSVDFYDYFKLSELIRHEGIHALLLSINKQLPGNNKEVPSVNTTEYRAKLAEFGVYPEHGLDEPLNLLKRTINLAFLRKTI